MGRQCPVGRAAAGPPAGGVVAPHAVGRPAPGIDRHVGPEVGKPVCGACRQRGEQPTRFERTEPDSRRAIGPPDVGAHVGFRKRADERQPQTAGRADHHLEGNESDPRPLDPVGIRPGVDREVVGEECLDDLGREGIVDEEEVAPPHAHDLEADPFVGERRVRIGHGRSFPGRAG